MSESVDAAIVKVAAIASGLIYLCALLAVSAAGGCWKAQATALLSLGACVLCYGFQLGRTRPWLIVALLFCSASWALAVAFTTLFMMGQ